LFENIRLKLNPKSLKKWFDNHTILSVTLLIGLDGFYGDFIYVPKLISLSDLFINQRRPDSLVAFEQGKPLDWGAFSRQVAGLCLKLKREPQGQWLLASQSTYAFAAGLCALWQTGNVAILPPNLQPGTLAEIAGEFCGVVGDAQLSLKGLSLLDPRAFSAKQWKWKALDKKKISLVLYTSGSTGDRKGIAKTLANLEEELAAQEATFGGRLGDCAILSTVSHQHIYGLLFRLLWPLCAGRPFVSETPLLWKELLLARKSLSTVGLVSSPAHLDYACAHGKREASPGFRAVFSSGAPLKKQTAKAIRERWGLPIIEVFGSTETGGVGWRIQKGGRTGDYWTPLPGVTISADAREGNRLRVLSPFATPSGDGGGCAMGDKAKVLADGRFLTDGRVDRILKIAGKRLSLDDMESRLNRHPWVSRTALTLLARGKSSRRYLGAVIALNHRGKKQLRQLGRLAADKKFRTDLKGHFDAVTLPRYFSYVDSLPVNSQGKISRDALNSLFQGAAFSEAK
jgi:acyl-coenzyme A synthetase/AMP-(fatty) acid ligase